MHHRDEVEFSHYKFTSADVPLHLKWFDEYEKEAHRLLDEKLALPAYDFCLKASHAFNMLDARGAISVAERTRYIGRVRGIARRVAESYIALREEIGHPLLGGQVSPAKDAVEGQLK